MHCTANNQIGSIHTHQERITKKVKFAHRIRNMTDFEAKKEYAKNSGLPVQSGLIVKSVQRTTFLGFYRPQTPAFCGRTKNRKKRGNRHVSRKNTGRSVWLRKDVKIHFTLFV